MHRFDLWINGWVKRHPRWTLIIAGGITLAGTTGFALWEIWQGSR